MRLSARAPITAIVSRDGADAAPLLGLIAARLAGMGVACAGFVQRDLPRADCCRCDMTLEDLRSGAVIAISENRGPEARGCRLDVDALLQAVTRGRAALEGCCPPDLLVVNKFGKTECEGGGFRDLIAEAVERGVPVLVAVSSRNLEGWRRFAEGIAAEHDLASLPDDPASLVATLGLVLAPSHAAGAMHGEAAA